MDAGHDLATEVPDFHETDKKLEPLAPDCLTDDDYSSRCAAFLHALDKSLAGKRVLDLGCGRGELVMRLRQSGVRAFGLEVQPRYVESGRMLNELYNDDFPVLAVAEPGAAFPYPNDYFDWVVSFQVLEHVRELEPLVDEISRIVRRGGGTAHILPAKFRVMEPHYGLPFVHWLPKGPVRARFVSTLLRAGLRPNVMHGHDRATRVAGITRYSNEETFYRTPSTIARCFRRAGLQVDNAPAAKALIGSRLPNWPLPTRLLGPVMNWLRTTVICARKR